MSQRSALLDLERRKLSLLRSKLAEQERRVQTLEAMDDDPFDALLERELSTLEVKPPTPLPVAAAAAAETPKPAQARVQTPLLASPASWGQQLRYPRRVPPHWVQLLTFISLEGKTYEQVIAFVAENKMAISEGAVRAQLMNYRKDFAFVENPRKGFYLATARALSFLQAQEGEGTSVGDGGAFNSQPAPLNRAAA